MCKVLQLQWVLLLALASQNARFTAATSERHTPQQHQRRSTSSSTSRQADTTSWLNGPEFTMVRRVYDDCQYKSDFLGCLKQKALHGLTRALDQDSIRIVDGLVLEKQNHTEKDSIIGSLADARTLSSLSPLDRALLAKADRLMRTHALKIDMAEGRGHEEEHEKKKKKKDKGGGHMKYVIAALLTAMGIAGPIGLKALAAIAMKALVISKVALTIAGIIALKKLFAQEHHEETNFQVHAGEHNRRSTYILRPVTKNNAAAMTANGVSASVDPYRYYYEYH